MRKKETDIYSRPTIKASVCTKKIKPIDKRVSGKENESQKEKKCGDGRAGGRRCCSRLYQVIRLKSACGYFALIRPMSHQAGVADVAWTLVEPPFDIPETHATKAVEDKGYFLS